MSWAEDHGYYHWRCRNCGMTGWTDTTPDCACPPKEEEEEETDDAYQEDHDEL